MKRAIRIIASLVALMMLMAFPIKAQKLVYSSNVNAGKRIALTFDDGPHPKITSKILDILDEFSIKATFFVIGVNVKNYSEQINKILEKGHEIGNHTYSHNILKSMSKEEIESEIAKTESQLNEINEVEVKLLRPPCGLYDETLENIAKEKNLKIVLWTIDTLDWEHASSKQMIKNVLVNIKDGDIILFHDYVSGEYNTPRALKEIIPSLKNMGYEFVTVSELLQTAS